MYLLGTVANSFSEIRCTTTITQKHQIRDKEWIVISDVRYEAKEVIFLSGDPIWVFDPTYGNLRDLYEGVEVTVHNCEPCEEVCKQYVDQEIADLQDQINKLSGVITERHTGELTQSRSRFRPHKFGGNSEKSVLFTLDFPTEKQLIPELKLGDEILVTGTTTSGRVTFRS